MKAITLIKNGPANQAFEIREVPIPVPGPEEILLKNEAFGLNYADVMARLGLYNDAPPLPSVLGYEVVGTVEQLGPGVTKFQKGDRLVSMCRFGGYAEYTIINVRATAPISNEMDAGTAVALATQYCTAYFAAYDRINLHPGERVLIHAAAGGVGTALIQLARHKGCIVYGTAGSEAKMDYLREQGVDHPINYLDNDFEEVARTLLGENRMDVVFDPVGGKSFKKSLRLLGTGGRLITYGASSWSSSNGGFIAKLKLVFGFGFLHPLGLMMKSKTVVGINMLPMADNKPETIQRCLQEVIQMTNEGILKPHVGASFPANKISEAHAFLESRKSVGKIVVTW